MRAEMWEDTDWDSYIERLCDRLRDIACAVESSQSFDTKVLDQGVWCGACVPTDALQLNEHEDSQKFCQKCAKILEQFFTDWGVQEEIEVAADQYGSVHPLEALILLNWIDSGFPPFTCRCGDFEYFPELKPDLQKIMKRLERIEVRVPTAPEAA